MPAARQVYTVVPPAQVISFPALIATGPAVTRKSETAEGKVNVHCSAAGELPAADAKDKSSVTVPPGSALPEESVKDD
jgi:hypothetical protein